MKNLEYLDFVDEEGNVLGQDTRENLHQDPTRIYRGVSCLIINSKKQLLLAQRSFKKKFGGGLWEVSSGGHVDAGEEPDDAVIRETKEEMGVLIDPVFVSKKLVKWPDKSALIYFYYAIHDGLFEFDINEVQKIKLISIEELSKYLKMNKSETMLSRWEEEIRQLTMSN